MYCLDEFERAELLLEESGIRLCRADKVVAEISAYADLRRELLEERKLRERGWRHLRELNQSLF